MKTNNYVLFSHNSIDFRPETVFARNQQLLPSTSLHFPQTSLSRRKEEREFWRSIRQKQSDLIKLEQRAEKREKER